VCLCREFFHVAGQIALQRIKSPTDIPALFFRQSSQLPAGFFLYLKPVAHRSFLNIIGTYPTGEISYQLSAISYLSAMAVARRRINSQPSAYSLTTSICLSIT
jgi:hypothetical protein